MKPECRINATRKHRGCLGNASVNRDIVEGGVFYWFRAKAIYWTWTWAGSNALLAVSE
jgi:hypothetical protein